MDEKVIGPGRKYLEEMKELDNLINKLKTQIEIENSMLIDTAVHYKDIQVQSSGAKDLIGEKMPEIADLMDEINEYVKQLAKKKRVALQIIKRLDCKRQQLLILHFMQNKTLEKTAEEMNKSYTWTWTEMQGAIGDFENLFGKVKI